MSDKYLISKNNFPMPQWLDLKKESLRGEKVITMTVPCESILACTVDLTSIFIEISRLSTEIQSFTKRKKSQSA